jgi:hypothetical protein
VDAFEPRKVPSLPGCTATLYDRLTPIDDQETGGLSENQGLGLGGLSERAKKGMVKKLGEMLQCKDVKRLTQRR